MSISTEQIFTQYLSSDEIAKAIAVWCMNGITSEKVVEELADYRRSKGYRVIPDEVGSMVASRLQSMEKMGILVYADNLWTTTGEAKGVLRKYFGFK